MENKLKLLIKKSARVPSRIYHAILFKRSSAKVGKEIDVYGRLYIKNKGKKGKINIGNNVRFRSSPTSNPIGCGDRCYFQIVGGTLKIGSNVGISNTAFTCADAITVGNRVLIGSGCKIYDMDFHPLNVADRIEHPNDMSLIGHKPIAIEDDVFIGAGCFILKGTRIGKGSVIGAGSVVSGIIPPNEIWAGNPAKFIRNLTEYELAGFYEIK